MQSRFSMECSSSCWSIYTSHDAYFTFPVCSFSKDSVLFFTLYFSSWMLLYACTRKLDGHSLFEERRFFWPRHAAFGILVPWQGIEHMPPAVKVQSLNHWTLPGKSLTLLLIMRYWLMVLWKSSFSCLAVFVSYQITNFIVFCLIASCNFCVMVVVDIIWLS